MIPGDYLEYWAAGGLNLRGQNPYDPELLFALQQEAGTDRSYAIMMWNPPWTLALVMPFGAIDYETGLVLWLILQLAVMLYCSDRLWTYFGGSGNLRWLPVLVNLTFFPTISLLLGQQISGFLALGVVGFLLAERQGKYWQAGMWLALVAVKPQVGLLFEVCMVLWAIHQRRWTVLVGLAVTLSLATFCAMLSNPGVFGQYLALIGGAAQSSLLLPLHRFMTPTFGFLFRLLTGSHWTADDFWLQFVPTAAGLAWLVPYWYRWRWHWSWADQMPLVLTVSLLTSSYVWPYDFVILMVPVCQIMVWARRNRDRVWLAWTAHVIINGAAVVLQLLGYKAQWYFWFVPAILAVYLYFRSRWECIEATTEVATAVAASMTNR